MNLDQLTIKQVAVVLFFIMFVYSGIRKIPNFVKNTKGLSKKTGLPFPMNEMGMIGVILLEIIGSLIIVTWANKVVRNRENILTKYIFKYNSNMTGPFLDLRLKKLSPFIDYKFFKIFYYFMS